MIEQIGKNRVIIPSLIFSIIASIMLLNELPTLVGTPHFSSYIIGRVTIIVSFLFCILFATIKVELISTSYPIIFYALGVAFGCHGQFFQPNYWMAYIQLTSIFPFMFHTNKTILLILMIIGLFLFDICFMRTSNIYIQKGLLTIDLSNQALTGTIFSTVLSYACASVLFSDIKNRSQLLQRFTDLEKYISSIIHEIKGMISGPCTYVDILSQRMKTTLISVQDEQVLSFMKEDLYALKEFVMEMNHLLSRHLIHQVRPIRVSEVIHSVKKVFKSRITTIEIATSGDMVLLTTTEDINRILINSITNSCNAIHKNGVANGKITIDCNNCLLEIKDNSREKLSRAILKKLNSGHPFLTKRDADGNGNILLIKEYVNSMKGNYTYSNHLEGVSLQIRFPKSIVLKTKPNSRR